MAVDPKKFEIPSKESYKLEKIRHLAQKLGHPELGRRTILVAGTNGKGSTCAFLTSLFLSTRKKVGTFSSPHVICPTERIRINRKPISKAILKKYETRYRGELKDLSFFERWTILAFLIFRDQKVDLQIIEVGMGGRLDATNICEPDLSLICPIDFDHQEVLGKSLKKIACEKAGIMRSRQACFSVHQRPEAKTILFSQAKRMEALLRFLPSSSLLKRSERMKILSRSVGEHQIENAALAYSAFEYSCIKWGWRFSKNSQKALRIENLWPGRQQVLMREPLIFVDGAHNPHSMRALAARLKRDFSGEKFHLIFGCMEDKPSHEMLSLLKPYAIDLSLPKFYPERQVPASELAKRLSKTGIKIRAAGGSISRLAGPLAGVENLLVTGSFYLVGEFLAWMKSKRIKLNDWRE